MRTPRGIRNHNPGNIDRTKEKWLGMADDQSSDARFVIFKSPEYGIRALCKVLINYQKKYSISTVKGIINRWAPPVENDTGSYVRQVSRAVGVEPTDKIDIQNKAVLRAMVKAIIEHENGQQPYADAVIEAGIAMAMGKKV